MNNKLILSLIAVWIPLVFGTATFKPYPLANDYFEEVYVVKQNNQIKYLTIGCKERNTISVSLTQSLKFAQAPRFNVYGGQDTPQMGTDVYTFLSECKYKLVLNQNNHFLEIRRNTTNALIFAIDQIPQAVHDDSSLTFTIEDDSVKYGLGERFQRNFHIKDGNWTIWNRDKPWMIDEGNTGVSQQTYGHQPIYLARQHQGNQQYHIAYFKNTYGIIYQSRQQSKKLKFRVRGGQIHFILFVGDKDPEQLLQRYHIFIGQSHIPPFWSLGFHQCRWGYATLAQLQDVVANFNKNALPLDTIWSDLDYMDRKMIFTINQKTHPPAQFNKMLKRQNLQFVPLIDVGVSVHDQVAMTQGNRMDVFLKDWRNPSTNYVGEVWPGQVHFVDYLHPNATNFWVNQLERLKKKVNFSGIWLDMNQPSNFRGNDPISEPFLIQQNEGVNQMTIPVQLPHFSHDFHNVVGKKHQSSLLHDQVHAYFGHLSTVSTHKFLKQYGRPFIISRSNSVGTGKFAGHWTGDNVATWDFMKLSINGNFLFQIFGIQMVGADICGFHEDTTEELCSRWMQLGSLYPFARNHNQDRARSQQPYAFGQTLIDTSRLSLVTRYALLKQMYTWMVIKNGTGSFFRPLFFQFFEDKLSLRPQVIETQFLIGNSLMSAPILQNGQNSRSAYFPGNSQIWYQIAFQNGKYINKNKDKKIIQYESGKQYEIENQLPAAPPLFLRASYILLTSPPALRSSSINSSFHLLAAIKPEGTKANGVILSIANYNSEEEIEVCIRDGCWLELQISRQEDGRFVLTWDHKGWRSAFKGIRILSVTLLHQSAQLVQSTSFDIDKHNGTQQLQLVQS